MGNKVEYLITVSQSYHKLPTILKGNIMATSSKKTTAPAASPAPAKKPATKKVAAVTPASKTKSSATATPAKKKAPAAVTTAVVAAPVKKVRAPKAEKPAEQKASKAKASPVKASKKPTVSPEERYKMVAEAAYYRAEQRGFATGHESEDWSASEAEIDAWLNA
jgi:outer membrane biosynthesis protein TonB